MSVQRDDLGVWDTTKEGIGPNASYLVDRVPVEEANTAVSKCGLTEDTGPFEKLSETENHLRTR